MLRPHTPRRLQVARVPPTGPDSTTSGECALGPRLAASTPNRAMRRRVQAGSRGARGMHANQPPNLDELIPTRDSLLSRLKDWRDDASWRDFFNTYWRLVYGVALKAGLTEGEAQEVVQETVITVARRIPEFKYDPAVCSFKT